MTDRIGFDIVDHYKSLLKFCDRFKYDKESEWLNKRIQMISTYPSSIAAYCKFSLFPYIRAEPIFQSVISWTSWTSNNSIDPFWLKDGGHLLNYSICIWGHQFINLVIVRRLSYIAIPCRIQQSNKQHKRIQSNYRSILHAISIFRSTLWLYRLHTSHWSFLGIPLGQQKVWSYRW